MPVKEIMKRTVKKATAATSAGYDPSLASIVVAVSPKLART